MMQLLKHATSARSLAAHDAANEACNKHKISTLLAHGAVLCLFRVIRGKGSRMVFLPVATPVCVCACVCVSVCMCAQVSSSLTHFWF